ncbi:MAG: hypothetical protein U1E52_04290 [Geminicoccaceae bacterium]
MSPSRRSRRLVGAFARLATAGVIAAAMQCGGRSALAGWQPASAHRFDMQLLAPLDLARAVDVLALPLFGTPPARKSCVAVA